MTNRADKTKSVWAIISLYRQFEEVARDGDITLGQYRMMHFLRRGAQRASDMAIASAVKKPTVSVTLTHLREKGWITEKSHASDARAVSISLTAAGQARMTAFEAALASSIERLAPSMNLDRLHAELGALNAGMVESHAERLKAAERKFLS